MTEEVHAMTQSMNFYREAALESSRITGDEPKIIVPVEIDGQTIQDEAFERHVVIMEAVLNTYNRRLIHPIILNMNLCNDKAEIRWRTGIPGAMHSLLPDGRYSQWLLLYWWLKAQHRVNELRGAGVAAKEEFAWRMHDFFLCLQPFVRGNGRTARMIRHNLYQVLEVPQKIITNAKAFEYYGHVREYREETFIPMMRRYGYI